MKKLLKLILPVCFELFNVATRKLKITQVAHILFLLCRTEGVESPIRGNFISHTNVWDTVSYSTFADKGEEVLISQVTCLPWWMAAQRLESRFSGRGSQIVSD